MPFGLHVARLTLAGGVTLPLSPGAIVVVVGPNNSGKTTFLRDINQTLTNQDHGLWVKDATLVRRGTDSECEEWLLSHAVQRPDGHLFRGREHWVSVSNVREWLATPGPLRHIVRDLVSFASAEERLSLSKPVKAVDPFDIDSRASHPVQVLYEQPDIEERVSKSVRAAFGMPLGVNRLAAPNIRLFLGTIPSHRRPQDAVDALRHLPDLSLQGDGVRSFVGCLLAATVGDYSIVLVDEPEAFLHPPQARFIGSALAKDKHPSAQLFIATHSVDVLRGLLDTASESLIVVRLTRHGGQSAAHILPNEQVAELWRNPVLRYSNPLDGLFHEEAIICEADGDCRFYGWLMDDIAKQSPYRLPDSMLIPSGGKHQIPDLVSALRAVGVPTRAIVDFDVLNDATLLERLVTVLGGRWSEVEPLWRRVDGEVRNRFKARPPLTAREDIQAALNRVTADDFPEDIVRTIRVSMTGLSSWAQIKSMGVNALRGQGRSDAEELLDVLRPHGLHVVPVGEMEDWVPRLSGSKAEFVARALALDPRCQELRDAREFVSGLVAQAHAT